MNSEIPLPGLIPEEYLSQAVDLPRVSTATQMQLVRTGEGEKKGRHDFIIILTFSDDERELGAPRPHRAS